MKNGGSGRCAEGAKERANKDEYSKMSGKRSHLFELSFKKFKSE